MPILWIVGKSSRNLLLIINFKLPVLFLSLIKSLGHRTELLLGVKKGVLVICSLFFVISAIAGEKIYLWQGTSVSNKSVTLEVFLPDRVSSEKTPAVIVCPGGSYSWHDYETEGTGVAKWLCNNGIAAFVLNYRVQGVFNFITHARLIVPGHHHPHMLQDGQRAIQYVREHAEQYGIDINRVGAMGFSAGGHHLLPARDPLFQTAGQSAEQSGGLAQQDRDVHPPIFHRARFHLCLRDQPAALHTGEFHSLCKEPGRVLDLSVFPRAGYRTAARSPDHQAAAQLDPFRNDQRLCPLRDQPRQHKKPSALCPCAAQCADPGHHLPGNDLLRHCRRQHHH